MRTAVIMLLELEACVEEPDATVVNRAHAAFAVPDDSSLDPCFDTDRD